MRKYIFLMRGNDSTDYTAFKEEIISLANLIKEQAGVSRVRITLTESPPPALSIIPFKKKKVAVLSVHCENEFNASHVRSFNGFSGQYEVTEALPVAYQQTWADGLATPGVCLLTLFRQKKGIDYNIFIDRWHNSHTPLSLKIHPLWNYCRNVVNRSEENSENWDGIVEEQFQQRAELLNPFRFFGSPWVIIGRMRSVYTDTRSFLDYQSIEPYLATEYVIKG